MAPCSLSPRVHSSSLLSLVLSLLLLSECLCAVLSFYVGPGVPYQLSPARDWLVHPETALQTAASFTQEADGSFRLSNGLISRSFTIRPNWATVAFRNLVTGQTYFRAPKAESVLSAQDGSVFSVGGLAGAGNNEALWQPYYYSLGLLPNAFTYVNHSVEKAAARFAWHPQRYSEVRAWPPAGVRVSVEFAPPKGDQRVANLTVRLIYEMYDGIPVLQKYMQVINTATPAAAEAEQLQDDGHSAAAAAQHRHAHDGHDRTFAHGQSHSAAAVEHTHSHAAYASSPALRDNPSFPLASSQTYVNAAPLPYSVFISDVVVEQLACPEHACDRVMSVETDYMPRHTHWDSRWTANQPFLNTTLWWSDPDYNADNDGNMEADAAFYITLLSVGYPLHGPSVSLPPGAVWDSFHVLELCHDSEDEERQNLARRRWMRTLAPQGTENPIYWHVEQQATVIDAIDQTVAAGFEMIILSLWSGFNAESSDPTYLAFMSNATAYAHSKGVLIGGYTLMQNPNTLPQGDWAVNPETGRGWGIACFATEGHRRYRQALINFINATGIDMLETDGPYEGAPCSASWHAYHRGTADSQAAQDFYTQDFYRSLKVRDIYFTVPDPYWLNGGTNKEPIGYTDRWSGGGYNKWERLAIGRMYSYDGTTHYPPTMGWMTFNDEDYTPLNSSLPYYELALAQYLGNGIVTCYRGQRLWDTPQTLAVVAHWAAFFKQHRTVLNADVLHVVRPNGQDVDVQLHVRPLTWPFSAHQTTEIALGFMFNPTPSDISKYSIRLSLYYAGSLPGDDVSIAWGCGITRPFTVQGTAAATVDESFGIDVAVAAIPAYQFLYFIITPA